jgi:hypothetical protein
MHGAIRFAVAPYKLRDACDADDDDEDEDGPRRQAREKSAPVIPALSSRTATVGRNGEAYCAVFICIRRDARPKQPELVRNRSIGRFEKEPMTWRRRIGVTHDARRYDAGAVPAHDEP